IYDDLDLPLGSIRIRRGGGSGGHKGIASVIAELGSRDFVRIRVGIGRPDNSQEGSQTDIISYVLTDFTPEEKKITRRVTTTAAEAVRYLLEEDLAAAMNKYNQSIANLKASGI
ncbi:MAG: aminoacyl-tRNA hydrolase, partial [Dehalococcoidales bacterium]